MTSVSELRKMIKYITFMKMTEQLAKGVSYDPKHQVGATIVKNDWTKIDSIGYNGAYKGSPNKRFSLESGNSKFVHAEMNAIAFSTLSQSKAKKYTMFVTLTPCEICSRLIVNKGIKNVVCLNRYDHCGDSLEVFNSVGVNFTYIDDMIREFYVESNLYKELLNIIDEYILVPNRLNSYLQECFEKQMGYFFEFNKSYCNKIPQYIINEKNINTYNKEYVIKTYIDLFVKKLYEWV
jgi:dCMP deaminase